MIHIQGGGPTNGAYRSYLVRFWQSNKQGCWRASAQCVQTGNTVLFGSVERLFAFLNTEIEIRSKSEEAAIADLLARQGRKTRRHKNTNG